MREAARSEKMSFSLQQQRRANAFGATTGSKCGVVALCSFKLCVGIRWSERNLRCADRGYVKASATQSIEEWLNSGAAQSFSAKQVLAK